MGKLYGWQGAGRTGRMDGREKKRADATSTIMMMAEMIRRTTDARTDGREKGNVVNAAEEI